MEKLMNVPLPFTLTSLLLLEKPPTTVASVSVGRTEKKTPRSQGTKKKLDNSTNLNFTTMVEKKAFPLFPTNYKVTQVPVPMQYSLYNFERSNQDTCLMHKPSIIEGDWVQSGDLLADCAASSGGELSLGHNLLVAYMPWEGYNFEDAILISERLVYDDVLTSIHIERYDLETRQTKFGVEKITRDIPDISVKQLHNLDKFGIAKIGSWVEEGDILIGKITPLPEKSQSPSQKFLYKLLDKKFKSLRDSSLRAPKSIKAKIIKFEIFSFHTGVSKSVSVKKSEHSLISPLILNSDHKNSVRSALQSQKIAKRGQQGKTEEPKIASQKSKAIPFFEIVRRPGKNSKKLSNPIGFRINKNMARSNQYEVPELIKTLGTKSQPIRLGNVSKYLKLQNCLRTALFGLKIKSLLRFSNVSLRKKTPRFFESGFAFLNQNWKSKKERAVDSFYRLNCLSSYSSSCKAKRRSNSDPKNFLRSVFLLSRRNRITEDSQIVFGFMAKDSQTVRKDQIPLLNEAFLKKRLFFSKDFSSKKKFTDHRFSQPKKKKQIRKFFQTSSLLNILHLPVHYSVLRSCLAKLANRKKSLLNFFPILKKKNISKVTKKTVSQETEAKQTQIMAIKVYIYLAEKRKIQVGDKMSGRHGNKGIVSNILPREDMPFLPDGTPMDIVLNPLGVPSRMNVGQIYESLLGFAGKYLGEHFKIYPFDEIYGPEASRSFVYSKLSEAKQKTGLHWLFNPNFPGKIRLFDGRTGNSFVQPITVGRAYMLKLVHMVDDKIHARSTGPYSLVTQQPLRGRSKQGGQRLGEMEVWAIQGYGAAFTLLEMLTLKSDDMTGRMMLWHNLIFNKEISIGTPESFKVLICELQALCLDIGLFKSLV